MAYVVFEASLVGIFSYFTNDALNRWLDIDVNWLVKIEETRGPLGVLLRSVGAIAVDRSAANRLVDQLVEEFRTRAEILASLGLTAQDIARDVTEWVSRGEAAEPLVESPTMR